MGRPRSFDTDATVRKIRDAFWRDGYVATTLQGLSEATGLRKGSLHAVFGTKEDLFEAAFAAYEAHFRSCMDTGLTGRASIRAYLEGLRRSIEDDPDRKGCLIVHSATEAAAHSPGNRRAIDAAMEDLHGFFVRELASDGIDDAALAAMLFGAAVALLTLGRTSTPGAVLDAILHSALSDLDGSG